MIASESRSLQPLVRRTGRPKQAELFTVTKPPRVFRMMPNDVGCGGYANHQYAAEFKCRRCGTTSEWLMMHTVAEIKRGIPCQKCNGVSPNDKLSGRAQDEETK